MSYNVPGLIKNQINIEEKAFKYLKVFLLLSKASMKTSYDIECETSRMTINK